MTCVWNKPQYEHIISIEYMNSCHVCFAVEVSAKNEKESERYKEVRKQSKFSSFTILYMYD